MVTVDTRHDEEEKMMTDLFETTVYEGPVEDWERHLLETEESEDEPEA